MVFFLLTLSGYSQNSKIYNAKDLITLKSLPVKWERYWNNHNMDSMGTLLRDDVDFITVGGTWLKGKKLPLQTINKNTKPYLRPVFGQPIVQR